MERSEIRVGRPGIRAALRRSGEVSAIVDDLLVEYRETFKKLAGP
jgi:hypothetical protein